MVRFSPRVYGIETHPNFAIPNHMAPDAKYHIYSKHETLLSMIRTLGPIRLQTEMHHENETNTGEIAHPVRVSIESDSSQKERETQHVRHTLGGSGFSLEQCMIWETSASMTRTTH